MRKSKASSRQASCFLERQRTLRYPVCLSIPSSSGTILTTTYILMPIRPRRPNDSWWSSTLPIPSIEFTILSSSEIINMDKFTSLNLLSVEDSSRTGPVEELNDPFSTVARPPLSSDSASQPVRRSRSDLSPISTVTPETKLLSFTNATTANLQSICIGDGLDASSEGVLACLVVSSALGLLFWVRYNSLLSD